MSVIIKLYQDNRESSKNKGSFYAHVKPIGTKNLRDIAEVIERNSSMKRSDVLAVLTEFSEVLGTLLMEGYRVKIEGLGAFKVGIRSLPALTEKDFSVDKNIKAVRVLFQAETEKDSSHNIRRNVLVNKVQFTRTAELMKKKPSKKKKKESSLV